MNFGYAKMWTFHNITPIQMEGDIVDSNLTHPILNWIITVLMVIVVKHRHPKLTICLVEGLEINTPQGLTTSSCTLFYHNIHAHYTPNINTMQITYVIMMALGFK
jgi:hypothetical protein